MRDNNNDFDDKIRRALSEEEARFDTAGGEQGVFDMMLGIFRGRLAWLNILGTIFQLAFMAMAIWSAFRFFDASEVKDQILYATLFLWGAGTTGMFKIWFWMLMNRNSLTREVKRLELEIAKLRAGA